MLTGCPRLEGTDCYTPGTPTKSAVLRLLWPGCPIQPFDKVTLIFIVTLFPVQQLFTHCLMYPTS